MTIVPQVKGLTVPEILEFAKSKWDILDYLPEHSDCRLLNRVFLWNIINSLIPDEFDYFVKENLADREKKMIDKRRLAVTILPEFIKIFQESKNISCKYADMTSILQMKTEKVIIFEEKLLKQMLNKDWWS